MEYEKIKEFAAERKTPLKTLASKAEMSEGGLLQAIKNKTIKVSTLELIAEALNTPITSFFDDVVKNHYENKYIDNIKDLEKRIEYLMDKDKQSTRVISQDEMIISYLKSDIKRLILFVDSMAKEKCKSMANNKMFKQLIEELKDKHIK